MKRETIIKRLRDTGERILSSGGPGFEVYGERAVVFGALLLDAAKEIEGTKSLHSAPIPPKSDPGDPANAEAWRQYDAEDAAYRCQNDGKAIGDVIAEYDAITANADRFDAEWDFVMRAADWRLIRATLRLLANAQGKAALASEALKPNCSSDPSSPLAGNGTRVATGTNSSGVNEGSTPSGSSPTPPSAGGGNG